MMERRTFETDNIEIRQADNGGKYISGYAVVYNVRSNPLGGFREMFLPGSFRDSLGGDIRALWQHKTDKPLGRTSAGTLQLREDDKGVWFELLLPNNSVGRDAEESIRRRDVDQMSFGFRVPKGGDDWIDEIGELPLRMVRTSQLFEVSPVTFPAYEETSVEIVRSAPEWVQRALDPGANDTQQIDTARARMTLLRRETDLLRLRGA